MVRQSVRSCIVRTVTKHNLKSRQTSHSLMRLLNSFALILICSVLVLPSDTDVIPPCGSSMTPEQAFERATAVFVGRVISIQTLTTPRTRAGSTTVYHEVKLEVEKSWKLVDRREITLTTQTIDSNTCGSFSVGETYLIYADRLNDTFFVSGLSRTNRIANAQDDLKMLGEGRIQLRSGEFYTYRIFVYGILGCILIVLATGLILYRISKKPFRNT
jgi:hypothetical protein